jgi:hypothetical protein
MALVLELYGGVLAFSIIAFLAIAWATLEVRVGSKSIKGSALSATKLSNAENSCLDGEIAADLLVVEHMRLLGRVAHLFDRDRVEVGEKGFARPAYGRVDYALKQHRI